jgi:hypothetical protein
MISLAQNQPVAGDPDYLVLVGGDYEDRDLVECYLRPGADLGDPSREGYEPPPDRRTYFAYYIAGKDLGGAR